MLQSLRAQVLVLFLFLLVVTLVPMGAVLAGRARHQASVALEQELTLAGQALVTLARALESRADVEAVAGASSSVLPPRAQAVLLDRDGAVLFASQGVEGPVAQVPEVHEALAGRPASAERPDSATGVSMRYLATPVLRNGVVVGVVRVNAPRDSVGAAGRAVISRVAIAGGAAAAAGFALAMAVTLPLVAALRALGDVARHLASGRLYERAEESGITETEELSHALNAMADSLERQVRQSYEERDILGTVVQSMADGLVVTDQAGIVTLLNPAAARLFGISPTETVGQRFIEVIRDHEIAGVHQRALATRRRQTREVEFGPDLRLLRVVATPIEERRESSVLVIVQDLTEVHRLQGMRRDFVANVSHELRTPLASIKASVEALQAGAVEEKALAADFLQRINAEVDQLTEMVGRLLELSRVETGKTTFAMEPLDLKSLGEEVVDRLLPQASRRQLTVTVDLPQELPHVLADRTSLTEVLTNLLGNALKFTPPGGRVLLAARSADGMVEVRVQDTGAGIAPEHLPHVFERFYKADRSRSSEGVGLGLALVKHLVLAHKGQVWAESQLGKGSTFFFTLPSA